MASSYPPGCNGTPFDDIHDDHPYAAEAIDALEPLGVPQSIIDKIVENMNSLAAIADMECPRCIARHAAEMCGDSKVS